MSTRIIRRAVLGMALLCCVPIAGITQTAMTWTGDTDTVEGFMTELAKAYETQKRRHVDLHTVATSAAILAVAKGSSDLAGTVRLPRQDDPVEAALSVFPVAWDAMVVIVNRNTLIANISLRDLKGLYTGRIQQWSDLMSGGKGSVRLLRRKDPYSGVDYNLKRILFPTAAVDFVLPGEVLADSTAVIKAVAEDPSALAISMFSHARRQPIRLVAVEGVQAQRDTIINGSYLLYQPVYFVQKRNPTKRSELQRFLRFVSSSRARRVLNRAGLVPYADGLGLVSHQMEQGDRIRNLSAGG